MPAVIVVHTRSHNRWHSAGQARPFIYRARLSRVQKPGDAFTRMRWTVWGIVLLLHTAWGGDTADIVIEYTTNGEVKLNIMNITFHTTELHVTLLGCDHGYYDYYRLVPPIPSRKTEVTPFHCLECQCTDFENERVEHFYDSAS